MMSITKPSDADWVAWALGMTISDYELLDYLMACMAYDMREFASSSFTAGSISYLLGKYGEHFTPVGNKLYKHYIREKHSYAY
jgi:hypothetical protein